MCLVACVYSKAIPVFFFLRFCLVLRGFGWGGLGVSHIGRALATRAFVGRVIMMSFIAFLYSVPSWVLFLRRFRLALVGWGFGRLGALPVVSGFVGVLACW